jgi:hypothetical protein
MYTNGAAADLSGTRICIQNKSAAARIAASCSRRVYTMESNVFSYFVAIGAGVSFGLSLGAVPAFLAWKWMQKRKGARRSVH